jgi:hypothetical protein
MEVIEIIIKEIEVVEVATEDVEIIEIVERGPQGPQGVIQSGDIEITDPTKGIILRSSDNNRWRLTIDNDGVLTVTGL